MSARAFEASPRLGKIFACALVFILVFSFAGILFSAPSAKAAIYLVGDGSRAICAADIDGDGDVDIVTANAFADSVSILRNKGNGEYDPQIELAAGDMPISVCVADLNGNGIADIATANYLANSISILYGIGDCAFLAQKSFAVGNGPIAVEAADINNDGTLDLVTANAAADSITILLGLGNGDFGSRIDISAGDYARSLAIADMDGNGFVDIAVANAYSGTLSVFLNFNGIIGNRVDYPAGSLPISALAADMNEDGIIELVSIDGADNVALVWPNDGTGKLGTPLSYGVGVSPHGIAIGDIDGDGKKDIVVSNADEDSVSVLIASENGFLPKEDFPVGDMPLSVDCGDLDGNGYGDICTANYNADSVVVLLNGVEFSKKYEPPVVGAEVSFTLRVAGKAGGSVSMSVLVDGQSVGSASVVRECGSPDEQSASIVVSVDLSKPCVIALDYSAPWQHGANPTWIIVELDGVTYEVQNAFNANDGSSQHLEYSLQDIVGTAGAEDEFETESLPCGNEDVVIGPCAEQCGSICENVLSDLRFFEM